MRLLIALLACVGPTPEANPVSMEPPPAVEAPSTQSASGSWRQQCGKNDGVVIEARADFGGIEMLVFSSALKPGEGPWPIQSAEGTVSYPPERPMVLYGGDFISTGTVREIAGGLAIDVQAEEAIETFKILAAYAPMSEDEHCG